MQAQMLLSRQQLRWPQAVPIRKPSTGNVAALKGRVAFCDSSKQVVAKTQLASSSATEAATAEPPAAEVPTGAPEAAERRRRAGRPNPRPTGNMLVSKTSRLSACAGYAAKVLRKDGVLTAAAATAENIATMLKALALAGVYLQEEERCIALVDMRASEGGLEVDLAVAAAQQLQDGTVLRIARNHSVEITRNLIVAKVIDNEPLSLVAAGAVAIDIAARALAAAQARLLQLGYRVAVVASFEYEREFQSRGGRNTAGRKVQKPADAPPTAAADAPAVEEGVQEPADAAPTAATEPPAVEEGTGSTTAGGADGTMFKGAAKAGVKFNVVLVENPLVGRPEAPPLAPASPLAHRSSRPLQEGQARVLTQLETEEAASPDGSDDPAAPVIPVTGPITLEVTEAVQAPALSAQIAAELRLKGSVRLAVRKGACPLALKALDRASNYMRADSQTPSRVVCDIATSSRDGAFLITLVTEPIPPLPPTPAAAADAAAATDGAAAEQAPPTPAHRVGYPTEEELQRTSLRVSATSEPAKIAVALVARLRNEGRSAMQCAYGRGAAAALGALVLARDSQQLFRRGAGGDVYFLVEGTTVEMETGPISLARLLVSTRPLK